MATSLNTKRTIIGILSIVFLVVLMFALWKEVQRSMPDYRPKPIVDSDTEHCIGCHSEKGNGKVITEDWSQSKHAEVGVGCLECHKAEKGDLDGYKHEGAFISTIVTPKDCAKCHEDEANEFMTSYHADAGAIMGSLDNVLAEVVEGHAAYNDGFNPAAANGCWQCHGSRVQLLTDKEGNPVKNDNGILQFDPKTWPNTGMGRINLDGSKGSCTACHNRHRFSVAQARQPENCGKCHLGPDHPQLEIYEESKHGINFHAHKDEMNLDAQPWIVGQDYNAAPTCATCHMSATPDQPVTHDVGDRISWTLRPKVSQKIDASQLAKFKKLGKEPPADFLTWEERREKMQNVCLQCHTKQYVNNFYEQYDNQVNMYNDKYGIPATEIMGALKKEGLLTPVKFDEELEMTFFLLWHHEGRRARMGASMMAPDYTQWHGNFEVAENFYYKFVPQVKEKIEEGKKHGNAAGAARVEKMLNETLNSEMHKWYLGKEDPAEIKRRQEAAREFRKRYSGE
jgi:formate-dependent nitrite reductase cytochrome c552 subunit